MQALAVSKWELKQAFTRCWILHGTIYIHISMIMSMILPLQSHSKLNSAQACACVGGCSGAKCLQTVLQMMHSPPLSAIPPQLYATCATQFGAVHNTATLLLIKMCLVKQSLHFHHCMPSCTLLSVCAEAIKIRPFARKPLLTSGS